MFFFDECQLRWQNLSDCHSRNGAVVTVVECKSGCKMTTKVSNKNLRIGPLSHCGLATAIGQT